MMIYLANISAGMYWNSLIRESEAALQVPHCTPFEDCPTSPSEIDPLWYSGLIEGVPCRFERLHLEVPSKHLRIMRSQFKYAVRTNTIPSKSYVQINERACVACPEYSIMQLANVLEFPQLIAYICELTGTYRLSWDCERRIMSDASPITSIQKCKQFFGQADGVYGVKKARRALKYATDGCASPMETELFIMLTLPKSMGGFGFPKPDMNACIQIPHKHQGYLGQASISPDMLWGNVALEYDSRLTHSSYEQINKDIRRANTLSALRIDSLSVRTEDMQNAASLARLLNVLASKLKRPRFIVDGQAATACNHLLASLRSYRKSAPRP